MTFLTRFPALLLAELALSMGVGLSAQSAGDKGYYSGFVFQAGAVQASGSGADGWPATTYGRTFFSVGREKDYGAGMPLLTWSLGYLSSSSKKINGMPELNGHPANADYSPGNEFTLAFVLSSAGRFRYGGGLEVRVGTAEPRFITFGSDNGGITVRSNTTTWLQLFSEAGLGAGVSVFVKAGLSSHAAPVPTREYGLGLRYRP